MGEVVAEADGPPGDLADESPAHSSSGASSVSSSERPLRGAGSQIERAADDGGRGQDLSRGLADRVIRSRRSAWTLEAIGPGRSPLRRRDDVERQPSESAVRASIRTSARSLRDGRA